MPAWSRHPGPGRTRADARPRWTQPRRGAVRSSSVSNQYSSSAGGPPGAASVTNAPGSISRSYNSPLRASLVPSCSTAMSRPCPVSKTRRMVPSEEGSMMRYLASTRVRPASRSVRSTAARSARADPRGCTFAALASAMDVRLGHCAPIQGVSTRDAPMDINSEPVSAPSPMTAANPTAKANRPRRKRSRFSSAEARTAANRRWASEMTRSAIHRDAGVPSASFDNSSAEARTPLRPAARPGSVRSSLKATSVRLGRNRSAGRTHRRTPTINP